MLMVAVGLTSCGSMIYAGTVTDGTFTGGDVGEGLDLDGTFLYAIDAGWDGTVGAGGGTVRGATFTDNSTPGSVLGGTVYMGFSPSLEYGDTANDDTLEGIIGNRIRAPYSTASASVELGLDGGPQLVEGKSYKLQLGFGHSPDDYNYNMCWDIIQWHGVAGTVLLKDNMFVPANADTGYVLTYEFTATSVEADYLRIYVQTGNTHGDAPPAGWDGRYPGLNMVTLEEVPEPSTFAMLAGGLMGLMGLFRRRR